MNNLNLNSLRAQIIFYWVLVQWSPAFLAPGTGFMEDKIFPQTWAGDGFRMIQAQYVYCVLFSCYGYISSTSDHQALDPGDPVLNLHIPPFSSVQSLSHVRLFVNCSTPGLPVHHQLPEFTQTHVHWVSDVIQLSHPLLSPSPAALNLSQHQGLLKCVSSSHQVAKLLEFKPQHQSFQWTPRTDLL